MIQFQHLYQVMSLLSMTCGLALRKILFLLQELVMEIKLEL